MSSKADKMFEKLNYKKRNMINIYDKKWGECFYNPINLTEIVFDFEDKEISVSCKDTGEAVYFGIEVVKAINEKFNELRWL